MPSSVAEGAKIKIRQYKFELSFNGLICKGIGLSQCSLLLLGIVEFMG